MLTHVSWVLWLEDLLVHIICLPLKLLDIGVISLFMNTSQNLVVVKLIDLNLTRLMTCTTRELVCVTIKVIIQSSKLNSIVIFSDTKIFDRNSISSFVEFKMTLSSCHNRLISVGLSLFYILLSLKNFLGVISWSHLIKYRSKHFDEGMSIFAIAWVIVVHIVKSNLLLLLFGQLWFCSFYYLAKKAIRLRAPAVESCISWLKFCGSTSTSVIVVEEFIIIVSLTRRFKDALGIFLRLSIWFIVVMTTSR